MNAIAGSGSIGVPRVLGFGTDEKHGAFLLLEWIKRTAKPARGFWENFRRRLGDVLEEPDSPSLLHGDLWSGNFISASYLSSVRGALKIYGELYEAAPWGDQDPPGLDLSGVPGLLEDYGGTVRETSVWLHGAVAEDCFWMRRKES